jgi:uncharacterized protein (DUF2141 family)
MNPPNKTIHFDAKKIEIQFDEFIDLNNPTSEVIISPPLDKAADITATKKTMTINLKNVTLKPNTTYSIYTGKAIKDIHEGNILDNLHYVFSTGDYIDSLRIKGRVIDALTLKPVPAIRALLYNVGADSNLFKGKPLYFAKGDSSGSFSIENLAKGTYSLYLLEDKNDNYHADDGESVGFLDKPITLSKDTAISGVVAVSPYHPAAPDIKKATILSERVAVKFDQPIDTFSITLLNGTSGKVFTKLADTKDSLLAWPTEKYDSLLLTFSSSGIVTDTILKRNTEVKEKPIRFLVESSASGENVDKYGYFLVATTTKPVRSISMSGISVSQDTVKVHLNKAVFLDSSRTLMALDFPFEEGKDYNIKYGPGSFISFGGEKNKDTIKYKATAPSGDNYGNLELTVIPDSTGQFNFQLVTTDGKVYFSKEFSRETSIKIPYISAGEYRMRVVRDRNGNGRWDAVYISKHLQPEEVIYYPDVVKIKANWEVGDVVFDMKKASGGARKP